MKWLRANWRTGAALAGILAVAAFARFHGIGRASIWFDEGATLGMVRLPFGEFVRNAWDPYLNNQILYYLLLRPWHLLGEEEAIVRGFSAVCSIAIVACTYFIGERLFRRAGGLAAACVSALSAPLIIYAQEARAYALATLLVCIAGWFLVLAVDGRRTRDVAAWGIVSVLAVYAHFFAMFTIAAQVVSLAALGWRDLRGRIPLLSAIALIGVGCGPILFYATGAPIAALNWVGPVEAARVAATAAWLAGGKVFLLTFFVTLLAVIVLMLRDHRPSRRWRAAFVLSWAIMPLVAMAAISQVRPVLVPRYIVFSAPAWALALGAVAGPLMERRRLAATGYALLAFVLISQLDALETVYRGPFEDWRTPALEVTAATRPGDAILYESPWTGLAFEYYLRRAPRQPVPLQRGALLFDSGFDREELNGRERVWLVLSRPDDAIMSRLASLLRVSHPVVSEHHYGPVKVILYDIQSRVAGDGAFGRPVR